MTIKKSKTAIVLECISSDDEMSIEEIAAKAGCTKAHVSTVKRRYADKLKDHQKNEDVDEEIDDEEIDSFIKKVKITPDKKHLTKEEDQEEEDKEYICGECGHRWEAPNGEHQSECPGCGEEFE